MGNGASFNLSGEQKGALTKIMGEKYAAMEKDGSTDEQIIAAMKEAFDDGRQSLDEQKAAAAAASPVKEANGSTSEAPPSMDDDAAPHVTEEGDTDDNEAADMVANEFKLKGSVIYQPFSNAIPSALGNPESPGMLKSQSSSQLLDLVNSSLQDDQAKIANFISQIKSGEVQSKSTSNFRQRRLTYGSKC
mmetsp:Transcript_1205/g.2740  ORF Transcript_1205/g.2740 Transcript_1205/m.2740 type:complete len:190 (-) Transcript_1205:18-587(-)